MPLDAFFLLVCAFHFETRPYFLFALDDILRFDKTLAVPETAALSNIDFIFFLFFFC